MQNSDFKTWALILLLLLGGVFQISKSLKPSVSRATADISAGFDREDQPYSVGAHDRAVPSRAADLSTQKSFAMNEAAEPVLAQGVPANAVGTTFNEKAADKKDEKCVKRIDKDGKEICKTKKKKKKAAVEEASFTPYPVTAPAKDTSSNGIEWGVAAVVSTNRLNVNANQADRAFESIEAWRKRLLDSPDLAETKVFIDHFQRNLVTADIFYKLTQEMMDDSRTDMKLLGVMCASQNTSAISFQMLAELAEKERSGSSVRSQIDQALSRYSDLGSLSILANIMRSNTSAYPSLVAVQKLDVAAKRYLTTATPSTTPTTTPGTTPSTTPTTPTTAATRAKANFTRFVVLLQNLSKSTDSTLRSQATTSLASLQTLLGAIPSPATAPTTTPATSVAAQ